MKRPTPKKLNLARTTIRVLAAAEIAAVAGGIRTDSCELPCIDPSKAQ